MIVNPVVYGGGGKEPVFENLSVSQVSITKERITLTASQNIAQLTGAIILMDNGKKSHVFPIYWKNKHDFYFMQCYGSALSYTKYSISLNTVTIYRGQGGMTMEQPFYSCSISYIPD